MGLAARAGVGDLAGALASPRHARARGATVRADLIDVAARIAPRHGRGRITLHLPEFWHRGCDCLDLFRGSGSGPPRARPA
jgi:hypothetical protein